MHCQNPPTDFFNDRPDYEGWSKGNSGLFEVSYVDFNKPCADMLAFGIGYDFSRVDIEACSPEEALERAENMGYPHAYFTGNFTPINV